jgi:hypothetical protein
MLAWRLRNHLGGEFVAPNRCAYACREDWPMHNANSMQKLEVNSLFRHMFLRAGLLLSLGLWANLGAVDASEVAGSDDPRFDVAVQAWLNNDEATALPELANLAQNGNVSAQILIAVIDKTAELQGPWIAQLSRDDRISLMRSLGGMSGVTWMNSAAESDARAAAWLQLWSADAPVTLGLEFARLGETRAARETFATLDARGVSGFGTMLDDPDFPASMRYLGWSEIDGMLSPGDLAVGDPQRRILGAALAASDLEIWLLSAPEALPLVSLCQTLCPQSTSSCTRAAFAAIDSYAASMSLGTPVQDLISEAEFAASPRGRSAVLRRAMLSTSARSRPFMLANVGAIDSCFAAGLDTEIQRYRTTPTGQ